jgi:hypothetical protein
MKYKYNKELLGFRKPSEGFFYFNLKIKKKCRLSTSNNCYFINFIEFPLYSNPELPSIVED